jgi:hypothetical protein
MRKLRVSNPNIKSGHLGIQRPPFPHSFTDFLPISADHRLQDDSHLHEFPLSTISFTKSKRSPIEKCAKVSAGNMICGAGNLRGEFK